MAHDTSQCVKHHTADGLLQSSTFDRHVAIRADSNRIGSARASKANCSNPTQREQRLPTWHCQSVMQDSNVHPCCASLEQSCYLGRAKIELVWHKLVFMKIIAQNSTKDIESWSQRIQGSNRRTSLRLLNAISTFPITGSFFLTESCRHLRTHAKQQQANF